MFIVLFFTVRWWVILFSQALEKQKSEFQYNINAKRSELEAEMTDLEEKLAAGYNSNNLSDDLSESLEKLDLAKRVSTLSLYICMHVRIENVLLSHILYAMWYY